MPGFGVIIIYAIVLKQLIMGFQLLIVSLETTSFDNLTSNQVGLPAELKHINKRRKRN